MNTKTLWFRQLAALGLIVGAGVTAACQRTEPTTDTATETAEARIERGRYLVEVSGCNDCHTPLKMGANGPEPDRERFLSGHPEGMVMEPAPVLGEGPWMWAGAATNTAFAGPWGITYAANLTPDEATGLGIWTEEMFINALRKGKKFGGGRMLNPPMPWPAYSHLTDEDAKAIFAFLASIKPIENRVPDWKPPTAAS